MSASRTRAGAGPHLAFWIVCGVGCAAPSFIFARMAGITHPWEIAGMTTAVATAIAVCAWLTASPRYQAWARCSWFGRWIKTATLIRATGLFFIPDLWAGFVSVRSVGWLAKQFGQVVGTEPNSFFWIYLTTLFQGFLVLLGLLAIAGALSILAGIIRMIRTGVGRVTG